ncbi:MAG: carboxypeptidase-like regulatory domain-containing protein, partial [Actinomycetota bacterium]|nr:carboxypeptidase-like regulatory domain-containing protein [Actinomycetota bacterium]
MAHKWLWSALTSATADWFTLSAEQPEQLADAQLAIKHMRVMAWGQSIGALEGAHVRLFDDVGHEVASSTADADGFAEFSAVPDGDLTVYLDTTEYNLIHGTELLGRWYNSNPSVAGPSVISVGWYESYDLTIMTAPPTRITGTLRVEENGSPGAALEGVVVEAYDRWTDPLSVLASATTGADGTYTMQVPDDGRELILRFDSRARNESRTPAIRTGWWIGDSVTTYPDSATIFSVAQGQTFDASAVMLQRTVAVGGVVRDSTGATRSGVYVNGRLRPNASVTDEALLEQIASASQQVQTDADGRFELDFADQSADILANIDGATVEYEPTEPSGLLSEYYSDRSTLASADAIPIAVGQRMAADATLTVGATVAGHVTDAWDRPVPNVAVYLKQLPSGPWSYRATTDQDGAYRALGLRAGEYEVRFDPENVMSTDPDDDSPLFYANQYWQDRLAEDDADAVVVAESTDVTG